MKKLFMAAVLVMVFVLLLGALGIFGGASNTNNPGTGSQTPIEPEEPDVEWLFEDVDLTTESNGDLPAPDDGVSYTVFVDGEEKCTVVYERSSNIFFWNGGCIQYGDAGWHFVFEPPSDYFVESGTVSIRVNYMGA